MRFRGGRGDSFRNEGFAGFNPGWLPEVDERVMVVGTETSYGAKFLGLCGVVKKRRGFGTVQIRLDNEEVINIKTSCLRSLKET